MERTLGWTGLLVEADKKAFDKLLTRNRKAYASPVCLSTKPYSMNVMYNATIGTLSSIIERRKQKLMENEQENKNIVSAFNANETENIYSVQCFPLYSILLAIGKTEIDYFGLDVEGSEYKILKTIPWHKVDIKPIALAERK
ncbi:hypothetical protein OUZ56_011542 [Daphnia magna]|uniref:Methyltransferase FkbM domain-containing protein n=1 Tax=Daphnia magna TaxID=35525 RepID=A0ABQ9Z0I3_9CRUS|nr:hypothetical protein OUZ56_011542 [Daphnia magna]